MGTFNDEVSLFELVELLPELLLFCSNTPTKLLGGVYESVLE